MFDLGSVALTVATVDNSEWAVMVHPPILGGQLTGHFITQLHSAGWRVHLGLMKANSEPSPSLQVLSEVIGSIRIRLSIQSCISLRFCHDIIDSFGSGIDHHLTGKQH